MNATVATSPFSGRTVLAMLLFGALAFVLALYLIGAGETGRGTDDGGAHAGGHGLNGYAAVAALLERRGWEVARSRSETALDSEDLVVLTPPAEADGEELARIIERRRSIGPTIVILPKWQAFDTRGALPGSKRGWVVLGEAASPEWKGFADDVEIGLGKAGGWTADGIAGTLPKPARVQAAGDSSSLAPLVVARGDSARVLAAFVDDGGSHPLLERMAGWRDGDSGGEDIHAPHALVLVFEPDLVNNMAMAKGANAVLADRLFTATAEGHRPQVHFDLTLNGLGRTANLLTLAFTPPFLAATLCLLLAAVIIAWRGLRRFGPPLAEARRIAFGKQQLVRNSAGIILRTRRFHLLGPPYAGLLRNRMARMLGLKRAGDGHEDDQAIDRALAAQGLGPAAFTSQAAALGRARGPAELLRAAQALKHLERTIGK